MEKKGRIDSHYQSGSGKKMRPRHERALAGWVFSAVALAAVGWTTSASADPILSLSTTTIQANSGQTINIMVNDASPTGYHGVDLWIQIGDGGADNDIDYGDPPDPTNDDNNGGPVVPLITNVSTDTANISAMFDGATDDFNPSDINHLSANQLLAYDGTEFSGSTTALDSAGGSPILVATLTLDASDMAPGSDFFIQFFNVGGDATYIGAGQSSDLTNESSSPIFSGAGMSSPQEIDIESLATPEPSTVAILAGGAAMFMGRRKRRTQPKC